MEDKETISNLTSINLTLSQILTQAQEKMLVLSKKLQTLQSHMNSKKPVTEKLATEKKKSQQVKDLLLKSWKDPQY